MEAASQVAKPSLANQHSRGYQKWPEVSDHSRIKRGRAKNRMRGKPRGRQPVFLMFKFKAGHGREVAKHRCSMTKDSDLYPGSDDTGTQLDQTPWKLLIALLLTAPLLPHAPQKVRLRLRTPTRKLFLFKLTRPPSVAVLPVPAAVTSQSWRKLPTCPVCCPRPRVHGSSSSYPTALFPELSTLKAGICSDTIFQARF